MKHLFSLLTVLCLAVSAMAQVDIDSFDKNPRQWDNISCSSAIVDNPNQTGLNLSCRCLQIVRAPGCENWSGAITHLDQAITGYHYVHALMYRNNGNQPNLKVTDNGTNLDIAPMTSIVANTWQDVVFDISDKAQVDFVFFMADRETLTEDAVVYIDDIILSNDATPRTAPNKACGGGTGEYELVWNEDFTDGSLDRTVWNIEVNNDGGGNNELQYYCEKAVTVGAEPTTGKQCLILTATKESYLGKDCTSGRVNSKGRMYYTFGRIDARIKFPQTANGLWPAFWQMGNNFDEVGWPRCGETDLIELGHQNAFSTGTQDRYFNGAMHVGSAWNTVWSEANSVTWDYSVEDTFHIVTMIWTPTSIDMYMDKDAYPNKAAYFHADLEPNDDPNYNRQLVFGKPNFVIANLAVGGQFPGIYNVNNITALANGPRKMYIDWIRIYQRGDANESFVCPSASDPIEPEKQQGIEVIGDGSQVTGEKVLHNGQLLIRHGEKIYDIMGKEVMVNSNGNR
ncbi:MAG: glycoside hydrolase family 16 protein [Bacteroidales bacterium]|nr:glycoside hydrolase family 16 protein [Bacteroidales bacterium]MDY6406505.1 glycoside hydrolase family 16 protein [Bacteroidales bacterium]